MNSKLLEAARNYEAKMAPLIEETQRPAYHLSPMVGWMNDPNGFCHYQGAYHLFYQYYPYDVRWGPMYWGHAVSDDLVSWKYLPSALAPDTAPDKNGCFSGSAVTAPDGQLLLMYTGNLREEQPDGSVREVQTQCIAKGDGLNFEKYPCNPVLDASQLPEGGSRFDFRDPKIWRKDGKYYCVVGNRTDDDSGSILLFSSLDAMNWQFEKIIDRSWNEYGKMWECPDYFELDGKQVLITSPQDMQQTGMEFHNGNNTMAIIGHLDENGDLVREHVQSLDFGTDYYAPQTVLSTDGRRISIGWMQNWDACAPQYVGQPWNGQMGFPRELSIKDGKVIQKPISEIENYHGRRVFHRLTVNEETSLPGIFGRTTDLTITIRPVSNQLYESFEMKLASGGQHYTKLTYKPASSILKLDRSHSGSCRDVVHERRCLVKDQWGELKLRILIDRFGIEVFVNDGEQVLSTTIYTPLSADGISFKVQGQAEIEVEKYDINAKGVQL